MSCVRDCFSCSTEKYCTFDEFVSGLEAKAISGEAVKVPGKGACGHHVSYKQHGSIYTRAGKPAVHFAGRLEHFDRDFKTILEVFPSLLKYGMRTLVLSLTHDDGAPKLRDTSG